MLNLGAVARVRASRAEAGLYLNFTGLGQTLKSCKDSFSVKVTILTAWSTKSVIGIRKLYCLAKSFRQRAAFITMHAGTGTH